MKKIVLSSLAALTLGSVALSASEPLPIFAKASKIKVSGDVFIGFTYNKYDNDTSTAEYELRRAYLQFKSYFLDNKKSYYRITMDAHNDNGSKDLRVKYAYMYLADVLPNTGVEVGVAHRPWHDYETHSSWYYRNIAKIALEYGNGGKLSSSADLGVNFKTKTKYFESEIGLFNGEGYHEDQSSDKGMSFEWRTTAHVLGVSAGGKQTTRTYFDISFFGQYNSEHKDGDDLVFGGLHAVYNMPSFLISAQYIKSLDTQSGSDISAQAGHGYSVNGEYRFGAKKEYRVLGRYDSWTDETNNDLVNTTTIAGVAWKQYSNVEWVANAIVTDNEKGSLKYNENGTAMMLTAEVKF